MNAEEAGDYVGRCHSLASLLEVSAYPKPGNIHRTRDSQDTLFEHFLAGSIATYPVIRQLALKAQKVRKHDYGDLFLGDAILGSVKEMMKWQRGGNVHLGIILLHVPLAAAAGAAYSRSGVDEKDLRIKLGEVIKDARPRDSVKIYEAIRLALPQRVLGNVQEMDVSDQSSTARIIVDKISPIEIFKLCSDRDSICSEWLTSFQITFEESCPHLSRLVSGGMGVNEATVRTFLYILSKHPDSLIVRKSGITDAVKVSMKAEELLKIKDIEEFNMSLWSVDRELWESRGKLNPGTTADLVSAAIFVLLLKGWRP